MSAGEAPQVARLPIIRVRCVGIKHFLGLNGNHRWAVDFEIYNAGDCPFVVYYESLPTFHVAQIYTLTPDLEELPPLVDPTFESLVETPRFKGESDDAYIQRLAALGNTRNPPVVAR